MYILVSGGTSTLVGQPTRMGIQSFVTPLMKCMRELGHTVEQRAIIPGEDLSKYDLTMIGLNPFYSMGARWTFGSYYALGLIAKKEIPGAILINDWDAKTPFKEAFFTVDNHWHDENFIAKPLLPRFYRSEMFNHIEWIWKAFEHMANDNSWAACIAPTFDWPGVDHGLTLCETTAKFADERYIDPTPWVETLASVTDETIKERHWVSASLHPADEWRDALKLTWPIKQLGVVSQQQERISEQEVVDLYARSWGLLSHPYYHSGSGFWRNRYNYGAANGCIILSAPYEVGAAKFGDTPLCPRPWYVEQLSDPELADLAYSQWAWLDSYSWPAEKMAAEVDDFLNRVAHGFEVRDLAEAGTAEAVAAGVAGAQLHDGRHDEQADG